MKKKLVLSLGSNLGNRYAYIKQAIVMINSVFEDKCTCSHFYTTPPWGDTDQAQFINMALYIDTNIPIDKCLSYIQKIESDLGRIKTRKWGPRSIDIDILFFGFETVHTTDLIVPHPHLHERIFVLKPLSNILPNYNHPTLNKTISQLTKLLDNETSLFATSQKAYV